MRKNIAIAALFLLSAVAVHAQATSIYITSSSNRFSSVQTGLALTSSGYQEQYSNFSTYGIGGGLTFNFLPVGPVRVGIDFRSSTRPGRVGSDTAFAGLKVGFNPPMLRFKPYLQASGGYVATRTLNVSTNPSDPSQIVGGTYNNRYAAWEILGGIDYPVTHLLDLRLVEIGGGTGVSLLGASNPSLPSNISLFTFNTGVVFHF